MIDVAQQWCCQIIVTQHCQRRCSNCTQLIAHHRNPEHMTRQEFFDACDSLAGYLGDSREPRETHPRQVIGMHGGEPLLNPWFEDLCAIMCDAFPDKRQRGLWTGMRWQGSRYAEVIEKTFGYINNNLHHPPSIHQPVLIASAEMIPDEVERRRLINSCWLQKRWSSAITPKGGFFCEVAAALDAVLDGPGGEPLAIGWWAEPIEKFQDQIDRWCQMCGVCVPRACGRLDIEARDDITIGNLERFRQAGSPRCKSHEYLIVKPEGYSAATEAEGWKPHRYQR